MKRNTAWIDNEIIYQIMIDRFNGKWTKLENGNHFMGGTLKGVTEKLDYIKDMGITTVWLSPISCSTNYHGYHITDFLSIDPHFGTMEDFDTLVDSVHKKGMKIIIDFVPNHCSVEHPYFKDAMGNKKSPYRKWFYIDDKTGRYKCFLQYEELAKINLDNSDAATYIKNVARTYCNHGVDGLRIDHAVGPSFAFWKNAIYELGEEFPDKVFFGEIWGEGIERKNFNTIHFKSLFKKTLYYIFSITQEAWQRDYIGILDGVLDFEYRRLLLEEIENGNRILGNRRLEKKVARHFSRYPKDFRLLLFLDNHDTDRFLFNCHGDISLLEEAIKFSLKWNKAFILYYGTEQNMKNSETIFSGKPYADLAVRECMDWSKRTDETLYVKISKWLRSKYTYCV